MNPRGIVVSVLLLAAMSTGCTAGTPSASVPDASRPASSAAGELEALRDQVRGLQTMLTDYGRDVHPEPSRPVTSGTFMAEISDISTAGARPVLVVDFVQPDRSSEFSVYRNGKRLQQRVPIAETAVVAVMGQDWAGPYNLAPDRVSPIVVPLGEFVGRWKADPPDGPLHVGYYITLTDGEVTEVEQLYYP